MSAEVMVCMPKMTGKEEGNQVDVTATEDLMREHGVLRRILLIYDAIMGQLRSAQPSIPASTRAVILETASIAKAFIEEYHQTLEEDYVFPEFRRAGEMAELIQTLREQHDAARALTDRIIYDAVHPGQGRELSNLMAAYIRMYEPHSAREDTVVFPELRNLVTPERFRELGEKFEAIEEQTFGENGFERIVNQVGQIEKRLGIYDLRQFTPAQQSQ